MMRLIQLVCVLALSVGISHCYRLYSGNVQSTMVGDVLIYSNDTFFQCDKIVCPENADSCYVSKQVSSVDKTVLVRENICYGKNGEIVKEERTETKVPPNGVSTVVLSMYRNGFNSNSVHIQNGQLSPQQQRELENLSENIQYSVNKALDGLSTTLGRMFY